jgi:predicted flap endonuclease-1-like 5' DNA nuclease
MGLFACCFWWFVLGFLLGWLANWLLARLSRRNPPPSVRTASEVPAEEAAAVTDAQHEALVSAAAAPPPRVIDVGAARAAGFNLKHDDDLTIIEGIGPKIDDLFHANGVVSFAQLARLSVPEMLEILGRGGPHFQLANPGTWAEQAALASENRWAELKRLQEVLISGRANGGI